MTLFTCKTIFLLIYVCCVLKVESARILCFLPTPAKSHQIGPHGLIQELALRGHKLVVASPYPKYSNHTNIEHIDLSYTCKIWEDSLIFTSMNGPVVQTMITFANCLNTIMETQILNPNVMKLIQDPTEKFDLVIVEYIVFPFTYALSQKFHCPLIGIVSLDASPVGHDEIGNTPQHSLYPDSHFFPLFGELTLFERINSNIQAIMYRLIYYGLFMPKQDELVRKYLNPKFPSTSEVYKYVDMLFVNAHVVFGFGRPIVPRMVDVSGIHIKPSKPLTASLQQFFDEATYGVVVFSLGTNVKSNQLPEKVVTQILAAFGELPYRFIWKWEGSNSNELPANVRFMEWLPQNDILGHKNVKLFIFQGGYHSFFESVSNSIPMIAIPFVGDQFMNANKIVYYGIGQKLDLQDIDKDTLKKAIVSIINNSSMKDNVSRMSRQIWDSPQTPLERAVWWTEYVLRHNGTRHLRPPVTHLPFYQLLYLDLFAVLFAVIFIFCFITYMIVKQLRKLFRKIINVRVKND